MSGSPMMAERLRGQSANVNLLNHIVLVVNLMLTAIAPFVVALGTDTESASRGEPNLLGGAIVFVAGLIGTLVWYILLNAFQALLDSAVVLHGGHFAERPPRPARPTVARSGAGEPAPLYQRLYGDDEPASDDRSA